MSDTFALCLFLAAMPFEQFSASGVTVVKAAGGLALTVWVLNRLRSANPVRWDPGLTLMALFVVWGLASGLWSIDPARSMEMLPTYALLLLLYFLIANVIRSEKQLSAAMIALWLGTLALVTSGAVGVADIWLYGVSFRVSGVMGNPNEYAAMLVACVPSFYWVFTRTRIPFRKPVVVVALAAAGITIIYSLSRGGIISVVIFLLGLMAFRQTRRRGMVFAAFLLILGIRMAPLDFWQRWEETRAEGGDVRTLELWPAGLMALAQSPLLGSGLGTNARALAAARGRSSPGDVVHNAPLAVAIELGLPGLALYLGFAAYALVRLLRALTARMKQGRSKDTMFAVVLVASFAGYVASWLKTGGAEAQKMHWVLLGLMSAYARILEQPANAVAARAQRPGLSPRVSRGPLPHQIAPASRGQPSRLESDRVPTETGRR